MKNESPEQVIRSDSPEKRGNPSDNRRLDDKASREFAPLSGGDPLDFLCVPDRCDLRCCTSGHPLVLNPYEIHRISLKTGLTFDQLEDDYFEESYDPQTGFPLMTINREQGCGFLSNRGCSIYDDRPLVCRLFPLGKLLHPDDGAFRTVLLSQNPCAGFFQHRTVTVGWFMEHQITREFDAMWEEWAAFVEKIEENGPLPDSSIFRSVLSMFVYNSDLPPGRDVTPEDYSRMRPETAARLRCENALEVLPRLKAIAERRRPSPSRAP